MNMRAHFKPHAGIAVGPDRLRQLIAAGRVRVVGVNGRSAPVKDGDDIPNMIAELGNPQPSAAIRRALRGLKDP